MQNNSLLVAKLGVCDPSHSKFSCPSLLIVANMSVCVLGLCNVTPRKQVDTLSLNAAWKESNVPAISFFSVRMSEKLLTKALMVLLCEADSQSSFEHWSWRWSPLVSVHSGGWWMDFWRNSEMVSSGVEISIEVLRSAPSPHQPRENQERLTGCFIVVESTQKHRS